VIEGLVRELGRRGRTVVMSTHNQEQAQRLSDSTVFLEAGRLVVAEAPVARGGSTPGS
jgi:ABC-type phosphate transport system ATPase subunit